MIFPASIPMSLKWSIPTPGTCAFRQPAIFQQFILDFAEKLRQDHGEGIWGAGESKLVAKLAAHNLSGWERVVPAEQTQSFLQQIPLHRLPLDELDALEKLGIKTVGQLGEIPLVELGSQFGPKAAALQKLGRGEDLVPFRLSRSRSADGPWTALFWKDFCGPCTPTSSSPICSRAWKNSPLP